MKTVKNTQYGDLTGQTYNGNKFGINVNQEALTSLEGSPKVINNGYFSCDTNNITNLIGGPEKVEGSYYCRKNKNLTSLEGGPKECINFFCTDTPKLKNAKAQIIKYKIKAVEYWLDVAHFKFEDIEKEFNDNLDKRVTRPSMRTLLGLNDDNSRI